MRYGRWKVVAAPVRVRRDKHPGTALIVDVVCECGYEASRQLTSLRQGKSKGCRSCAAKERSPADSRPMTVALRRAARSLYSRRVAYQEDPWSKKTRTLANSMRERQRRIAWQRENGICCKTMVNKQNIGWRAAMSRVAKNINRRVHKHMSPTRAWDRKFDAIAKGQKSRKWRNAAKPARDPG